jgi:signal transduction histidine kinase
MVGDNMIYIQGSNVVPSNTSNNLLPPPVEVTNGLDEDRLDRLATEIKEVTTLYNIGVAVGSSLNLKEVVWALYKETGRLLDTSNFAIATYDPSNKSLVFSLIFDHGQRLKPMTIKLKEDNGLIYQVVSSQAPILISDLLQIEHSVEMDRFNHDRPTRSWLGVPIVNPALVDEVAQGVIITWSYEPNIFSSHDLWLLSAIGTQAAIAIRNANLFEASQRRAREMAVINDVARTLASTLQLDEVLTRIMEQVESMLDAEAGSLLLTDTSNGDLVFQIALGDKAKEVKPFRVPKGQGIAGEVAETGESLMVADVENDDRHFKSLAEKVDFHIRNILCVPLVLHDRTIGVLEVMNKRSGNFNQHDLKLLSSIASYAAIAIDNARLHESVLAERDRVIEAEEQARKKLARDLHDGPTQWVSAILMSTDFCKQAILKSPHNALEFISKEFHNIEDLAKRSVHQLRTALFELRPLALETQGLQAALEVFLERRQKEIEGVTNLKLIAPRGLSRQDDKVETTIFAIAQETVNNAIKHAQANNIVVELTETPDNVYAVIRDDGKGFNVQEVMNNYEQRGSLGMINLRERTEAVGGDLNVHSAPGEGTTWTIVVPKKKEERNKRRTMTGTLTLPPNIVPD